VLRKRSCIICALQRDRARRNPDLRASAGAHFATLEDFRALQQEVHELKEALRELKEALHERTQESRELKEAVRVLEQLVRAPLVAPAAAIVESALPTLTSGPLACRFKCT